MDTLAQYWPQILKLKERCKSIPDDVNIIGFNLSTIVFFNDESELAKAQNSQFDVLISTLVLRSISCEPITIFNQCLYLYFVTDMEHHLKTHLQLYIPLATINMHHRHRSFVVTHMAQSLDGKVCTISGTSKWIGNTENLKHAHRIRALVDGVIVGGNTARSENPSLNVRHVEGPNPARIILCNSSIALESLPDITNMRNFLLCKKDCVEDIDSDSISLTHLKIITYSGDEQGQAISCALANLRKENVTSILLEGGPTTIKAFMQSNAIDWLQLHTAPLIFGSGHSFVSLPEITEVNQAKKLSNVVYTQMGDAMVVTGQL
ncbi:RibD family protein [Agaribacter marinus]|nr:RibD family protein [Agaribacter marinus]